VGGFPEPFLANDETEARRWRRTHLDSILREDLLDLERVRDLRSVEMMVDLLKERAGSMVSLASLARDLQVSAHTVKHWLEILETLYVIFPVRPYHKNIARSLLKESKYYFYDTGALAQAGVAEGAIFENAIACALQRELHLAEDLDGRKTSLCLLRDKERREVDFLTVIDRKPRQLVEAKLSDDTFSKALGHFQRFLPGTQALQVVKALKSPRDNAERTLRMLPATDYLAELSFIEPPAGSGL
jgi:predicted AAA+ superfamily ATPase